MIRLTYTRGGSHKFWGIARTGEVVTTQWGRIGTDGQTKAKTYASEAAAQAAMDKAVAAKRAKGYAEPGAAPVPPPDPEAAPADADATDLADGESRRVPGSGGRTYALRNVGGVYSCSCPAWRNQSEPIDGRTCKHLRRFRGEDAELARLGALPQRSAEADVDAPALLLAQSFDPQAHDPTGWWMSEKLDGVRALWDGSGFVSRRGNPYLAPDWFTAALPDQRLDGELFAGRGQFSRTVGVARRIDAGDQWRTLRFVVFDAPDHVGDFEARMAHLASLELGDHAEVLAQVPCVGGEALLAELARIEGLGGEGLMLRQPGSSYVAGRSDTLRKVKTFFDAEAIVTGHVAGAGRHLGRLGAVEVALPDGTPFKVGTGFSDAQRANPPAVGTIITFRYQELTAAGVPRFPTFVRIRVGPDGADVDGASFDWGAAVAAARR